MWSSVRHPNQNITNNNSKKKKRQKHCHYIHDAAASYQIWHDAYAVACSTAEEVIHLS